MVSSVPLCLLPRLLWRVRCNGSVAADLGQLADALRPTNDGQRQALHMHRPRQRVMHCKVARPCSCSGDSWWDSAIEADAEESGRKRGQAAGRVTLSPSVARRRRSRQGAGPRGRVGGSTSGCGVGGPLLRLTLGQSFDERLGSWRGER